MRGESESCDSGKRTFYTGSDECKGEKAPDVGRTALRRPPGSKWQSKDKIAR